MFSSRSWRSLPLLKTCPWQQTCKSQHLNWWNQGAFKHTLCQNHIHIRYVSLISTVFFVFLACPPHEAKHVWRFSTWRCHFPNQAWKTWTNAHCMLKHNPCPKLKNLGNIMLICLARYGKCFVRYWNMFPCRCTWQVEEEPHMQQEA